jgi:glutamine synthetase
MLGSLTDGEKRRVLEDAKGKGVQFVDLEFVDILGAPKMCEITVDRLEETLTDGTWFDGSSIEGFARIAESDMFLVPDTSTWATLPWTGNKTARIICDVFVDEKTPFMGDPRNVLRQQLKRAADMGFEYKVGPELEFFLFKGQDGEATQVHDQAGYFDLATLDAAVELARRWCLPLRRWA